MDHGIKYELDPELIIGFPDETIEFDSINPLQGIDQDKYLNKQKIVVKNEVVPVVKVEISGAI